MDGTLDISGTEQESICLRYVSPNLEPLEQFIGFYSPPDTCAPTLAAIIRDALLRLNLDITNLRGQTYDGAANMSRCYNGCQAQISKDYPLAFFVHCGAHCANLVAQNACQASTFCRDAPMWVNEVGLLYNRSSKYMTLFHSVNPEIRTRALKPLFPTRWSVSLQAIKTILD